MNWYLVDSGTGSYPRDFTSGKDPWRVIIATDVVPILKRKPEISERLAEVIDHALRDKPEIGFKTAEEFKRALEEVL